MGKKLSKYERGELKKIHIWKSPNLSFMSKSLEFLSKPLDYVYDKSLNNKIGDVLSNVITGIVKIANDTAQWTVRPEAIIKEFQTRGFKNIKDVKDIQKLDLEDVDKVIGWLDYKYKGLALLEGGTLGAAGLPGLAVDIPAIIFINLRAIGEFASYFGFDVSLQNERLFAMNVLAYASSPTDKSKQIALAQLIKISQDVAKRKTWKVLEEYAFVQMIQSIAKAVGLRLTKAKLAQIMPVSGAIVGAGFNTYYTSKVCDAAFYLYRERYLAEKYGPDAIEVTVKPAKDLHVEYPEESE